DVADLTLGVDRIEVQGGFARAGQAGNDDQLVAGQIQINVLQVVGACPTYRNCIHSRLPAASKARQYTCFGAVPAKNAGRKVALARPSGCTMASTPVRRGTPVSTVQAC